MASTYTTNTGIELIDTGEQSGTWGDTTNVNLQIIDRLTNGVGSITLSGTTHTLTTTDGTLSDGQYAVLVFGGSPSGTNTVTVSPNDQQKVFIVKNGSGQTVVLTQGSGGNVTLLNGDSKIVYCDGAGASAAVVDVTGDLALSDVNIDGGSIDGVTLGTNSPVTEAQIDNLNLNGNAITSTNTNGNIAITPNGTGEVDISKVDINGGAIDGTVIGGSTPAAGGFTNVTVTGTVDGRDVAADGSKLDGIETNADVTDTANVTAAGALMDSELTDIAAVKALDQGVATTDSPTFVEITAAQYNSTEALPDIKPSLNLDFANTKALDPRITYTRASTGTYYDGKTFAKAEENLLLQSQDFTTTWANERSTDTADATTAPDGTTTADAVLQASGETSAGNVRQEPSVVAGDYVISIFAKPNGKNFLIIRENLSDGVVNNTWFNLSTGAVGTTYAGHTAAISASENGFYRCSIVLTVDSARTAFLRFSVADADGTASVADDGNGLYLWGAQLEQRDALTDYTPTTTQPITNYVPALQTAASGEPRFDHDPITGNSKGFLIEEQRTNLLVRSEEFDNAYWTKSDTSITSNTIVAPDGTLTGDKFIADATAANHVLSRAVTVVASTAYTWSCYVKAAEYSYLGVEFYGSGGLNNTFDLINGTVSVGTPYDSGTNPSGSITPVGNGWYRVTLGITTKAGDTSAFVQLRLYEDNTYTASFTGDGYSGIYIWGAQLEAGAFPTSYIKTTTAQATRNADAASMTGTNFSSWYRQDEGTFYSDAFMDRQNTVGGARVFQAENATSAALGQISVFYRAGGNSGANAVYNGVQFDLNPTGVLSASERLAVCLAYSVNDVAVSGNGGVPTSDNTATIPYIEQIKFGYLPYLNGHIKKLAYYPKRLSNATLQALTEE